MKRKVIFSVFAAIIVMASCTAAASAAGTGGVPPAYQPSAKQDSSVSTIEIEMGLGEEVALYDFFAESVDLSNFSIDVDKDDILNFNYESLSAVAESIGSAKVR